MLSVGKLTNRGEVSAQDHKLVSSEPGLKSRCLIQKSKLFPLYHKFGISLGVESGKPRAIGPS